MSVPRSFEVRVLLGPAPVCLSSASVLWSVVPPPLLVQRALLLLCCDELPLHQAHLLLEGVHLGSAGSES